MRSTDGSNAGNRPNARGRPNSGDASNGRDPSNTGDPSNTRRMLHRQIGSLSNLERLPERTAILETSKDAVFQRSGSIRGHSNLESVPTRRKGGHVLRGRPSAGPWVRSGSTRTPGTGRSAGSRSVPWRPVDPLGPIPSPEACRSAGLRRSVKDRSESVPRSTFLAADIRTRGRSRAPRRARRAFPAAGEGRISCPRGLLEPVRIDMLRPRARAFELVLVSRADRPTASALDPA